MTDADFFKLPIEIQSQVILKSSHAKKFLQSLKSIYPHISSDIWAEIFPSKCMISQSKLLNSKNIVIYNYAPNQKIFNTTSVAKAMKNNINSNDHNNNSNNTNMKPKNINKCFLLRHRKCVLFFECKITQVNNTRKTKSYIIPSINVLWYFPHFLRSIYVHPNVSKFILRGADLMLPGVSLDFHRRMCSNNNNNNNKNTNNNSIATNNTKNICNIQKHMQCNDIVCVKVLGNPLPIAVGYALMSSQDIRRNGTQKGRFLRIINLFRDSLWEYNGKLIPNPGFQLKTVQAIYGVRGKNNGKKSASTNMHNKSAADFPELGSARNNNNNNNKHNASTVNVHNNNNAGNNAESDMNGDGDGVGDGVFVAEEQGRNVYELVSHELLFRECLNPDQRLEYAFFQTLLEMSSSVLPIIADRVYQRMNDNDLYKELKVDVKSTECKKLARFIKQSKFEDIISIQIKKSKIMIDTMNEANIAKFLLLTVNQIDVNTFDSVIVHWFQQNWHTIHDNNNNNTNANSGGVVANNNQNVDETELKSNALQPENNSNTQQNKNIFELFADFCNDSNNNSLELHKTNAILKNYCLYIQLFGMESSILECNSILEAFWKQVSYAFEMDCRFKYMQSDEHSVLNAEENKINSNPSSSSRSQKSSSSSSSSMNNDFMFRIQFLATLKYGVKPEMLPISASSVCSLKLFWILKPKERNAAKINLKKDVISSIKQTNYKKLSKFIKEIVNENVIHLTKNKSNNKSNNKSKNKSGNKKKNVMNNFSSMNDDMLITKINYNYLQRYALVDYPKKLFMSPKNFEKFLNVVKKYQNTSEDGDNNANNTKNNNNNNNDEIETFKTGKIVVRHMYRANHRLHPIFGKNNISKLHTLNKARTFLWAYVKNQNLISRQSNANVYLNEELYHMLFESKQFKAKIGKQLNIVCEETMNNDLDADNAEEENKNALYVRRNGEIHRRVLIKIFDKYMQIYSAIIINDNNNGGMEREIKYREGLPPTIDISVDKRQGRKFMTHVLGLEQYSIDYKEFCQLCRTKLASSTKIANLFGKKNQMRGGKVKKEVLVQGNMTKIIPDLIVKEYGLSHDLIKCNMLVAKVAKK